MREYLSNIKWINLFWSLVFIVAAFLLWKVIKGFRNMLLDKTEAQMDDAVKRKATINMVGNTVKYIIIGFCVLTVLQINGINVSSILAGLGIAGAIAGLAWQEMFKDFIQGVRIVSDGFFAVGDFIRYNGADYQVVELTTRTTRLRSLTNDDVVIVCNRNITEITRISGVENILVGLPYGGDDAAADKALAAAAKEIEELGEVESCRYLGLKSFGDSALNYLISVNTSPRLIYTIRRESIQIIKKKLDAAGIEIPFNQLDVHFFSEDGK